MKRLPLILWNALIFLSLLLFLAALVLWVRSARHLDRVDWIGPDHGQVRALSVWTLNGKLVFTNRREPLLGEDQPAGFDLTIDSEEYSKDGAWLIEDSMNRTGGQFAGFGWHPVDTDETYRVSGYLASGGDVLIPFWFVAGGLAVLPMLWLRRRLKGVRPGHCGNCGYDLRATPERCPECGAVAIARDARVLGRDA